MLAGALHDDPLLVRLIDDLEIFERAGDLASLGRCLENIARRALTLGAVPLAVRAARHGLRIAAGDDEMEPELWGLIAQGLAWRNHFRDAAGAYLRAAQRFAAARRPDRAFAARLARSVVLGLVDASGARTELIAMLDENSCKADPFKLARVLVVLGELDLAQGDAERARVCCDSAAQAVALAGAPAPGRLESLRGRVELALGRAQAAETALAGAVQRLEEPPSHALGRALEGWAQALEELGRLDEAAAALARAAALWGRMGDLRSAARSELLLGATYVKRNDAEVLRHVIRAVELMGRAPAARQLAPFADELLGFLPRTATVQRLCDQLGSWRADGSAGR